MTSTVQTNGQPLVSCVMVTADRPQFCRRAVRCYLRQTYGNKELVVVDDGRTDLSSVLSDVPSSELKYIRVPPHPDNILGRLRNVSLENASGRFVAQWDDDDWYHPDRIALQVEPLISGADACVFAGTLMHLDTKEYFEHPFQGFLPDGIPGTVVHVRDDAIRYPEMERSEDTVYLQAWQQRSYVILPRTDVHLFIRCFHGGNTWEVEHFVSRLRNSALGAVKYGWHKFVRGNLFGHPSFQLDDAAREAFTMYLEDSYSLGIFEKT